MIPIGSRSNYFLTIQSITITTVANGHTNQFRHLTTWNNVGYRKQNKHNIVDCLLTCSVCYLLLLYT